VLQMEDQLLQESWDHHLVGAIGRRASPEDPIGVLEERDAPPVAQGLHDLLAVPVAGLGREHGVAVNATDRRAANVVGGVERPDRVGPHGKDGDRVVERGLVAGPGLQAGDAVGHVVRHPRLAGDVELQLD